MNMVAQGNWPEGWSPTMDPESVYRAYGNILNQLVKVHPGCISHDRQPAITLDKGANKVVVDFLMECRDSDHGFEITDSLTSLLVRNGLRYTDDWK